VNHLIERGARAEIKEKVFLIDAEEKMHRDLQKAGYEVLTYTEEGAYEAFGVEVVPYLLVRKGEAVIYGGAYGKDQQHTPSYEDTEIIDRAKLGEFSPLLPMFGCANGKLRKSAIDFWGLKYE